MRPPERDPRSQMLAAMLRRDPSRAGVLDRHPERGRIAPLLAPPSGQTPADILWAELSVMEREAMISPPPGRSPLAFYERRATAARWLAWADAGTGLPDVWARVLRLGVQNAQGLPDRVGVFVIAAAALAMPPRAVTGWLSPLGGASAGRVVEAMSRAVSVPGSVAERWRQEYESRTGAGAAGEAPASLGLGLLAALFRALEAPQRELSARLCRSTICRVLDKARPLALPEGGVEAAERIVAAALRSLEG